MQEPTDVIKREVRFEKKDIPFFPKQLGNSKLKGRSGAAR